MSRYSEQRVAVMILVIWLQVVTAGTLMSRFA